jgi:hypothetical protein
MALRILHFVDTFIELLPNAPWAILVMVVVLLVRFKIRIQLDGRGGEPHSNSLSVRAKRKWLGAPNRRQKIQSDKSAKTQNQRLSQ